MKTHRMSRSAHSRNATHVMLARGEYRRAPKTTPMFSPGGPIDIQIDLPAAAYTRAVRDPGEPFIPGQPDAVIHRKNG